MFMKILDFHSILGLVFSISESIVIQVNQTLFCSLKLGMSRGRSRAFDYNVEPQLAKKSSNL